MSSSAPIPASASNDAAAAVQARTTAAQARGISDVRTPESIIFAGFTDPVLFANRELSWLDFNDRVLQLAEDESLPLLERVKFLAIFVTNLDEFFMIRVAGLKQQILGKVVEAAADGMTPVEQLRAIHERVHKIVAEQDRIF